MKLAEIGVCGVLGDSCGECGVMRVDDLPNFRNSHCLPLSMV